MSGQAGHFYEFGPFRIDATKRLLLRDGLAVQLTPKVFDTLLALVQNRGRVLEKDELLKMLWPDSFVEEGNLTVNISVLRKALGESAGRHQFIVTIPGKGYRFVADVVESVDEGAELVLEKHTLSQTVRLEEEDVILPDEAQALQGVGQKAVESGGGARIGPVWKRSGAARALALLVVGLSAALSYFWMSGRAGEGGEVAPVGSIAVLPFKPLNAGDQGENYLGVGITDALITRLGGIRQIGVRPTSAVLRFDNPRQDSLAAARALGVEAVLEGSYQREGERLRVTVQLVSARDGAQVWSGTFEDEFTNIFAVQDSISKEVAQALVVSLSEAERRLLAKRPTASLEAYQSYLKGRYFWNKRTPDDYRKAIEYFEKAVSIDPNYAVAYTGIADSYALLQQRFALSAEEAFPKAEEAARKALTIDETLAEAHASMGSIKALYNPDLTGAEEHLKRAIELNPGYAMARGWYGMVLIKMGRFEESAVELTRAQEIDPTSLNIAVYLAWHYYYSRQYDRAIEQAGKALELEPNVHTAYLVLSQSYEQKGKYEQAVDAELARRAILWPESVAPLKAAYQASGIRGFWQKDIELLKEKSRRQSDLEFWIARRYALLGHQDLALEELEAGYRSRGSRVYSAKVEPAFDGLRSDPRFHALLRRMRLSV